MRNFDARKIRSIFKDFRDASGHICKGRYHAKAASHRVWEAPVEGMRPGECAIAHLDPHAIAMPCWTVCSSAAAAVEHIRRYGSPCQGLGGSGLRLRAGAFVVCYRGGRGLGRHRRARYAEVWCMVIAER